MKTMYENLLLCEKEADIRSRLYGVTPEMFDQSGQVLNSHNQRIFA